MPSFPKKMRSNSSDLPTHNQFKDKPVLVGRVTPRRVIMILGAVLLTWISLSTMFKASDLSQPHSSRPEKDVYDPNDPDNGIVLKPAPVHNGGNRDSEPIVADGSNKNSPLLDNQLDAKPTPPLPGQGQQKQQEQQQQQKQPSVSEGDSPLADSPIENDGILDQSSEDEVSSSEPLGESALDRTAKARKNGALTYGQLLGSARKERDYAIALIVREADLALRSTKVYSVTNKNQTAPSNNIHDYLSLSKYYWPDPKKPGGLPYKRIDGHVNPEIETVEDYRLLRTMIREVHMMGMAYHFTGNADYADKCAMRLKEWFLDEATYMNPNINYGSLRKGEKLGARTGVLDMFTIFRVFDALHYLKQEPNWPQDLIPQLQDWFTRYVQWLDTSVLAKVEREGNNNHGTYYDVQVIGIYIFLGRVEDARQVAIRSLTRRIDPQIRPDGSQPEELERKTSWYYSVFNLQALMTLARWGDDLGVDMWNHEGPEGQSIKKAIDFMLPYSLNGGDGWPVPNIKGYDMTDYLKCLQIAWNIYGDEKYLDAIEYLQPLVQKDMDEGKIKTISTFMCDMSTLLEAGTRGGQGFIWHWCLT